MDVGGGGGGWGARAGESGPPDFPPSRGSPTVPDNLVLSSDKTSCKELRTIRPLNYFNSFPVRLSSLSSVLF